MFLTYQQEETTQAELQFYFYDERRHYLLTSGSHEVSLR